MLDRFSVCFSNAWSQNHNASVEYNEDTMIAIKSILRTKLNLLEQWPDRGEMRVIVSPPMELM